MARRLLACCQPRRGLGHGEHAVVDRDGFAEELVLVLFADLVDVVLFVEVGVDLQAVDHFEWQDGVFGGLDCVKAAYRRRG